MNLLCWKRKKIADRKHEELRRELNNMKDKFAGLMAEEILSEAEKTVSHEFEAGDHRRFETHREESDGEDGSAGDSLFGETSLRFHDPYGQSRLRCGAVVKEFAVGAGGKGGGSDTQAQVIFSSLDTMRNFILIAQASV